MAEPQKLTPSLAEEDLQSELETQDPIGVQVATEEGDSSSTRPSSSYSSVSIPNSSNSEQEFAAAGASRPQSPPSVGSSISTMVSPSGFQSAQGSSRQSEGQPTNSQAVPFVRPRPSSQISAKVSDLVQFLLVKYRMREQTTKEEIMNRVIRDYQEYYPEIFHAASRYMLLIFGTEVKEVDLCVHSYVLVPALDLTYDGMQSDMHGIPKTGLLIIVLWIIFKQGSRARKEVVWRMFNSPGVFGDMYRSMYVRAWKLITEDFVQEGYLLYRQVPRSDPAQYEFLWGPRAHAETSPMKLLMFVFNMNRIHPRFY